MRLRRIAGLADCCELMGAVLAFPNKELEAALRDGRLLSDACGCIADAGGDVEGCEDILAGFVEKPGEDGRPSGEDLFESLRISYSYLFVRQGGGVAIFPYESAYRHVAMKMDGVPVLFRAALTVDVEKRMREFGLAPRESSVEPCDSAWSEFSFLSFLFGRLASAVCSDERADEELVLQKIKGFWEEHVSAWMPSFLKDVEKYSQANNLCPAYVAFARLGLSVCAQLESFVKEL